MGRRTKIYTVPDEEGNRDAGKRFKLTEMSASKAEAWAARVILAVTAAGLEIPDNVDGAGMAGIATLGMKAIGGLKWYDISPLLDEMMECVKILPTPGNDQIERELFGDDDIEEVKTRLELKMEVFELHTGFSFAGVKSRLALASTTSPA